MCGDVGGVRVCVNRKRPRGAGVCGGELSKAGVEEVEVVEPPWNGGPPLARFAVASREDASDVVEDVGCAGFVVAEVFDEALFDDVDLLLGFVIDDAADEVLELDGVALVLEELEFQRAIKTGVGVVLELLAVE